MNILCCTDHKYIMPCCVMIKSIIENNNAKLNFHIILDKDISEEDKILFKDIISNNCNIVFYTLDSTKICHNEDNIINGFSVVTYFRLFISSLLPKDIDKILYLDCDVIIRDSLDDLYNTDLTDYALAAAPDMWGGVQEKYDRLEYNKELGYFNAGVLLINLKYWRENNLQSKFIEYIENNKPKLKFHDQDVLNVVCLHKKKSLPIKYNVQDAFYYKKGYMFDASKLEDEINEALLSPVILHYTVNKPWEKGYEHPYKHEFVKYQNMTIFNEIKPFKNSNINTIKETLVYYLRHFRLIPQLYKSDLPKI